MSTTPLTKKQLVIAGVTTAGLLLSPSVLADENAQASPLVGTVAPATQATSDSEPEISREPVIAKAATLISAATDSIHQPSFLQSLFQRWLKPAKPLLKSHLRRRHPLLALVRVSLLPLEPLLPWHPALKLPQVQYLRLIWLR